MALFIPLSFLVSNVLNELQVAFWQSQGLLILVPIFPCLVRWRDLYFITQRQSQGKCWNTPKQETILILCFKGLYLPFGGQAEGGSKHISTETPTHHIKGNVSQSAFCEIGPYKIFWEEGVRWTNTWENREYYFLFIEIHIPKNKNKKYCKNKKQTV